MQNYNFQMCSMWKYRHNLYKQQMILTLIREYTTVKHGKTSKNDPPNNQICTEYLNYIFKKNCTVVRVHLTEFTKTEIWYNFGR